MNNIYVEGELPRRCNDCPYYEIETEIEFVGYEKNYHKCLLSGDIITGTCPLKSLSEALAEERKRVVKEIRDEFEPKNATEIDPDKISNEARLVDFGWSRCKERLFTKLDQVERGK